MCGDGEGGGIYPDQIPECNIRLESTVLPFHVAILGTSVSSKMDLLKYELLYLSHTMRKGVWDI